MSRKSLSGVTFLRDNSLAGWLQLVPNCLGQILFSLRLEYKPARLELAREKYGLVMLMQPL